jgi:5-hydroxyisourate hydrolase-like protein (transthyretin family)
MIRGILAGLAAGTLAVAGLAGPAHAAPATGTIRGTYATDAGAPIAGASVRATVEGDDRTMSATTDASGRYQVVGVPAGPVRLEFRASGVSQWAPRAADPASAATFTVLPGLTLVVDERQLPTGTVQGRLTTATGTPVAGRLVDVHSVANRSERGARTDADGRYTVTDVQVGQVKVEFSFGGFTQWAHGANDFASASTFTVVAGQTLTVDEAQFPTGTVTGLVTDAVGTPVRSTFVAAEQVDGGGRTSTSSAADGRYTLTMPAGRWRIAFWGPGNSTPQWTPGQADKSAAEILTVGAGQSIEVNEALLPTGSISGTMRYAGGNPFVERSISLWRDGVRAGSEYTDEDGAYSFPGVLPGEYTISYSEGYFLPGTVRPERATLYTVRAGENTEIDATAPAPGTLSGRLTLPGGEPVAGFLVSARRLAGPAGDLVAFTEPDGSWQIPQVFPEDYVVSFTNRDSAVRQDAHDAEVFTIRSGETTTVNETWQTGASVTVTAVDATSGEPVSGYCVTTGRDLGRYCTEGSRVTVAGLLAGSDALTVEPAKSSDHVPSAAVPVTLTEGEHATVTVPVTLGGRVNTLIVDRATGEPVHNACVVLVAPGAGGIDEDDRACTNKQGKVTTWAKPAGRYQIFVYAPYGHGAQWVTPTGGSGDQREATVFRVKAGKTVKADPVLLDPAGTITGVVRDPAGQPVPEVDVDVTAWDIGAGREAYGSPTTDSQGRYTIRTLGPYAWPLLFTPVDTYPRQWSGGVGNRFQAETVTVQAGASTTYDTALLAGGKLAGDVTVASGHPAYAGGRLTAVNAATGDQLAVADFPGQGAYELTVIGGNPVKIAWYLATPLASARGWWENAADLETATKVNIPKSGTKTLNLTLP